MNSIQQVSAFLAQAQAESGVTQDTLAKNSGTARRTLTHVLSGTTDYRVSTLLAVSWALGYEMVLIPRGHSQALTAGAGTNAPLPGMLPLDDTPISLVQKLMAELKRSS